MKKKRSLTFALASLALAVSALAQNAPPPTPPNVAPAPPAPAVAPAPAGLTDDQLVEEFGWFIAKRVGLPELQFSPSETDALIKGFATALKGGESPYDLQVASPQMNALMQRRQGAYLAKLKAQSSAETADFFNKLKDNKAVITTASGLRYEIVKPGLGDYPKPADTVVVNYTGKLVNGSVFDSSGAHGGKPAEFQLDQVIPGWTEGIQKINKGGTIRLYIPAGLAYGDQGRPGIPPGSTLIFDVELVDVKVAAPPPAMPAAPAAPAPAPTGN